MYTVFLYVGDHCILWCCEHLRLVLVSVILYNTMGCYLLIGKCVYTMVCHHEVPPCQVVGGIHFHEIQYFWSYLIFLYMYRIEQQPYIWQARKATIASLRSY